MSTFSRRRQLHRARKAAGRIRPHRAGDPEPGHRGDAHGGPARRRGRRPRVRQSRGSARGRSSSACPGCGTDGHDHAAGRALRAGPSRWSSSGRSTCASRSSSSPDARAVDGRRRPTSSSGGRRASSRSPASRGRTARRRRRSSSSRSWPLPDRRPGLLGTIESRVGGERRGVQHTTPEAIDLQRTFREMLDAGDRSCAMEASSHAARAQAGSRAPASRALVFTNLTQDHLDFHGIDGGLLRGEAPALRRAGAGRPAARRRPSTSATRTARGSPRSSRELGGPPAHVRARDGRGHPRPPGSTSARPERRSGPTACDVRTRLSRPLQRRERPRRRSAAATLARACRTTRSCAASRTSAGVPGPARAGRRGPAVRRPRRLRAHAGRARARARRRRARSAAGG